MLRRLESLLLAAGVAGLALPAAQGATFGLKSHGRAVSAINPSAAYHDLRDDTGWQLSGPVSVSLNADSGTNGAGGAYCNAVLNASSSFGVLHIGGYGSSTNSSQTGDFSFDNSYIGGEPNAQYFDRLEIISSTLPAGTPVTLQFKLNFAGNVSASADNGGSAYSTLHGQLFAQSSTGSAQPWVQLDVGDSTNTGYLTVETGTVQTAVGSYVSLADKFWIDTSASTNQLAPIGDASFAADGTTYTTVDVMTPGASFVADSAGTYVPEPGSLGLLLAAGGALAARRRRRA